MIAYTGAVAPEAIEATGLIGESHRDVGLLAVTSADRLHAGWSAARNLRRERRGIQYLSHVEKLLAPLPRDCGIVTVIDGHPAALGWLGSVRGHRLEALGVEQFGQTGTIGDLYRHYGIDANAIIDAAESLTRWRAGAAPQNGGVSHIGAGRCSSRGRPCERRDASHREQLLNGVSARVPQQATAYGSLRPLGRHVTHLATIASLILYPAPAASRHPAYGGFNCPGFRARMPAERYRSPSIAPR